MNLESVTFITRVAWNQLSSDEKKKLFENTSIVIKSNQDRAQNPVVVDGFHGLNALGTFVNNVSMNEPCSVHGELIILSIVAVLMPIIQS